MVQLLHHQDTAFYGKEFQGCRWSILQFFGFRRRLQSTKMLSDKKHGQGKIGGGSRRRGSYVPLKDEDRGAVDDDKNTQVKNKHKASKKNSGKTSLRSLVARKLFGKEGQKEKMLPVAPKLLRTLSIHYLESHEYVLDGESALNGDGSSHSAKMAIQNATSANSQLTTFNSLDGSDTDTIYLLLPKRGDAHMKRKSHRSISMDGVLHKVPYGQKVAGDVVREELPRSASALYDRDGLRPYIGTATKKQVNQGFRRSRSLSESLESYSHLLDSISSSESKRVLTSSKSTRDHSFDVPGVATVSQRTSNSQFRSKDFTRPAENLVVPEDSFPSHVSTRSIVDGDVNVAMDESSSDEVAGDSKNHVLLLEYMSDKKCDAAVSAEAAAPLPSEVVDISEKHTTTCDDDDQAPSSLCTDPSTSEEVDIQEKHATSCNNDQIQSSIEADASTVLPPEDTNVEEHVISSADDQIQSCTILPSQGINVAEEHATSSNDNQVQSFDVLELTEGTSCLPDLTQEIEAGLCLSCEQETESPTCVLDVPFSDDPSSSVKHIMLNVGVDDLDDIISAEMSTTPLTHENVQESDFDDLNGLQIDPNNETELNYVKDIFKKSSFRNEAEFDVWYSRNIIALQEVDCQHYEAAAAAFDFTDMSTDELLLFDLTNEALLDIYKKYSVSRSKLSWFCSSDRPKPVGHHILKELCPKVICHLDEQPRHNVEIDTILSNDLAKSDNWVNFQRDADHLGNKLADLVLDKLLTELTLQLASL